MPTFRNALSVPSSEAVKVGKYTYTAYEDENDSVSKRRHITFGRREITQM
jgi:hypothetical protein